MSGKDVVWDAIIHAEEALLQNEDVVLSPGSETEDPVLARSLFLSPPPVLTPDAPNQGGQTHERSLVFVGSESGGKSSLISVFLGEQPPAPAPSSSSSSPSSRKTKPTQPLEYTFARKVVGASLDAALVHLWELGGGYVSLAQLLDVALPPHPRSATMVVVVDLSRPDQVASLASRWLAISGTKSELGAPVLIAAKHDTFAAENELVAQRVMAGTLRALAHAYGATLVYSSLTSRSSLKRAKAVLNSHAFGSPTPGGKGGNQTDPTKALYVPAGSDSFTDVGPPPTLSRSNGKGSPSRSSRPKQTRQTQDSGNALDAALRDDEPEYNTRPSAASSSSSPSKSGSDVPVQPTGFPEVDAWLEAHALVFGRSDPEEEQDVVDAAVEQVYREPTIDKRRAEREAHLEDLRKHSSSLGSRLFAPSSSSS